MSTSLYRTYVRSLAGVFAAAIVVAPSLALAVEKSKPPSSDTDNSPALTALVWLFIIAAGIAVAIIAARRKGQASAAAAAEAERDRQAAVAQQLAAIDAGTLPVVEPIGIIKLPGEQFFFSQPAQHGQVYKNVEYVSSNPALYVPLGHGFRARVAGSRGQRIALETFMWDGVGIVYMSRMRICFKPSNRVEIANIPLDKIISYDLHDNGLALMVEGIGVQQFRTGDAMLAQIFKRVVDGTLPGIRPVTTA